jgi:hypothetical protein
MKIMLASLLMKNAEKNPFDVWKIFERMYICIPFDNDRGVTFRDSSMVEHSAVIPTSRDVGSKPAGSVSEVERKARR